MFAGGFDLESACAIAASDDGLIPRMDLLDALVRKSLIVADRSSGQTRFSMLETIREFADEQLVADRVSPKDVRDAHARYFAGREADIMALWDSPRQREAYDVVHHRTGESALRIPMGGGPRRPRHGRRDRHVAGVLGYGAGELRSPRSWAEQIVEQRRAQPTIRGLVPLYRVASLCWIVGRIDDAVGYIDTSSRTGDPRGTR